MTDERVVAEELLSAPSQVAPTMFVGVGGAGCKMVTRVARHLRELPDYRERYKELIKFAMIDTNINDLESLREVADESFLISNFEKEEYANLAAGKLFLEADDYFTQWVPQNYRFRAGDTAGAGQIRIESRLGLYYQMRHGDLVPRFRRMLEAMKSHEHGHRRLDTTEIRIIFCFSIAGGTGSGSFLPLAYTLRDLASELGKPTLIGVCIMPATFEDKVGANKDGTFANGYAALKETDYLMRLGAPESRFYPEDGVTFHYDGSDPSKRTVHQQPFNFMYLIDRPESYSVTEPLEAAADGLFLQFFSPIYGQQAGDYDNYTQHQRFLVPHDFEAKGIVGYTQYYGSFGAAVLLVPVAGLVDYCSKAAALRLLRLNVLGEIPPEPRYSALRQQPALFYEVRENDDPTTAPVKTSEFHHKEEAMQQRLNDRLFQKRVRLLAACEFESGQHGRFLKIFRHGHRPGSVPGFEGVKIEPDVEQRDLQLLRSSGMAHSLAAVLLEALAEGENQTDPGLLAAANQAMSNAERRRAQSQVDQFEKPGFLSSGTTRDEVRAHLNDFKREARRAADQPIKSGYTNANGVQIPGFDTLDDLNFLRASGVESLDLSSQRSALLAIRDAVEKWDPSSGNRAERQNDGRAEGGGETIKDRDAYQDAVKQELARQMRELRNEVKLDFLARRNAILELIQRQLASLRDLDADTERFAGPEEERIDRIRREGDSSANQFTIDSEALQIENGRRMWDFYFEDKIANLREVSLDDPDVQTTLTKSIRQKTLTASRSKLELRRIAADLEECVRRKISNQIAGDRMAKDADHRHGLKLSTALKLEAEYRALYRTNQETIEAEGRRAIRNVLATYRGRKDLEIDLRQDVYQEYFRDKVRRIEREKAGLICSYDESRDQHGGVRPNHIFLGAIAEEFDDPEISDAIRSVRTAGIRWVTDGYHDPHKIIFYRAVLNVPLYVFGRMNEMKEYYYRFKNLAKRSKVLHVDKNWEDALPDLDPDGAQEKHRQETVRKHIINFGVLLTLKDNFGNDARYIMRQSGSYYLRPPTEDSTFGDTPFAELGDTLMDAIEQLPDVLDAERVKYIAYQRLFRTVHDGLAPAALKLVVPLPIEWRKQRDQLRTKYGTSPSADQQLRLKDFTDSYTRMAEALIALLDQLRNIEAEQHTIGGGLETNSAGLTEQEALRNLRQSIQLLSGFEEGWRSLENPEQAVSKPTGFSGLFVALNEDELQDTIEVLRSGEIERPQRRPREQSE